MKNLNEAIFPLILFLSVSLLAWVGFSYFEAKAYNRATGKNISTWQAMFLQLRVQEKIDE